MRDRLRRFVGWMPRWRWVVAMAALTVGAAMSDAQMSGGQLSGTVTSQGAVLPGVTVEVINEQTGQRRVVTSDVTGTFRIVGLDVGLYTVRADLAGFQTRTQRHVQVGLGQSATISIDFGGPVPSVEEVVVPKPGRSTGGPSPSPSPSSPPPRCQVSRESFSEDIRLSNWMLGRKGAAITSIIGRGVGSSLFVQCPKLGRDDPEYVVVPVPERLDQKRLQDRINQNEALVFVGIHQLSKSTYAMVFRRDER